MRHRIRRAAPGIAALVAVSLLTSGFSSCAGTTGPLFVPFTITPSEILLRASGTLGLRAIGLARIDGGEAGDRYRATVEYGKNAAGWLTVEVAGRNLTLRADPRGIEDGVYVATVTIEELSGGATGSLQVEFTVTR
jgi:hypothetical protein